MKRARHFGKTRIGQPSEGSETRSLSKNDLVVFHATIELAVNTTDLMSLSDSDS